MLAQLPLEQAVDQALQPIEPRLSVRRDSRRGGSCCRWDGSQGGQRSKDHHDEGDKRNEAPHGGSFADGR
jgi:hypothetical protein